MGLSIGFHEHFKIVSQSLFRFSLTIFTSLHLDGVIQLLIKEGFGDDSFSKLFETGHSNSIAVFLKFEINGIYSHQKGILFDFKPLFHVRNTVRIVVNYVVLFLV